MYPGIPSWSRSLTCAFFTQRRGALRREATGADRDAIAVEGDVSAAEREAIGDAAAIERDATAVSTTSSNGGPEASRSAFVHARELNFPNTVTFIASFFNRRNSCGENSQWATRC